MLLFLVSACLVISILNAIFRLDAPDQHKISFDAYCPAAASSIPPPDCWRPITTPINEDIVWFRARVEHPRQDARLAIFVPYAARVDRVSLFGQALVTGPRPSTTLAYFQRPLLEVLTQNAPHDPYLYVRKTRIWKEPNNAPQAYVGSARALTIAFERERIRSFWLPFLSALTGIAAGLLSFAFFCMRRVETFYGYLAMAAGFTGLQTLWNLGLPLGGQPAVQLLVSNLLFASVWEMFLVHRLYRLERPRLERAVLLAFLASTTVMLLISILYPDYLSAWSSLVWVPAMSILAIYAVAQYPLVALRQPTPETVALGIAYALGGAVIVRDALELSFPELIPGTHFYFFSYVGFVINVVFSVVILNRFRNNAKELDALNMELSERIQQKTEELEATHRLLRHRDREKTLAAERERLMRDMHDGLGGHLVHAIAISERQQNHHPLTEVLHAAFADLHLIVDSLTTAQDGLASTLANLRHRLMGLVAEHGMTLKWHVDTETFGGDIPADQILALMRLIQEATNNAVRHSGGTEISVTLTPSAGSDSGSTALVLWVSDNGRGIGDRAGGRGMKNMEIRARELGSTLQIIDSDQGVTVTCTIPPARTSPDMVTP